MAGRAYDKIRNMVELLGGTMTYERKGLRYGAWIISVGDQKEPVEATGNRSFPDLDRLYVPTDAHPRHWDDYSDRLVDNAEEQLMSLLRSPH